MFIFLIFVFIIIAIIVLRIATSRSSQNTDDYLPYSPSISNSRPKISAEVSEDFYYSVREYCQAHSMTISALIREAVMSYINSNSPSDITLSKSTNSRPSAINPDGSWKCSFCGRLNAKYVGTCACGGTKDSPPPKVHRKTSSKRKDGSWKCPKCGIVNAAYVGTCSCGQSKNT